MVVGENFGKFDESGATYQSFPPFKFTSKTADIIIIIIIIIYFTSYALDSCHDYWEKFNLKYFHPVKQKSDLPDPSGSLNETVPLTAVAAVNVKVAEALNEAEVKKSASRACGAYSFLTSAQKY